MKEKDISKTAFVTEDGHCEFTRSSDQLILAKNTSERNQKILRGVNNVGTYIDDIVIYTESWQEHVQTLDRQVLQLIQEANLTLKPSKCSFGQEQIEFISHIISSRS